MTQEEKQILFQELCSRLLSGVKVQVYDNRYAPTTLTAIDIKKQECIFNFNVPVEYCLPYLRPMSSMTEEEKEELLTLLVGKDAIDYFQIENGQITNTDKHIQFGPNWEYHWINFSNENIILYVDWLNKKHFDYRGLIPMGLALTAPKGMYNIK